jgi:DNA-binding response OmpR family regulator
MHAPFILLIEDDVRLRTVLARNLEAQGYMVLEAGTFREVVAQLAVKPLLMILDITLPDATGGDVARWLESLTGQVPIVRISGTTPEAKRMKQFHPVAFLPKPFTIQDFLTVVKAQLPLANSTVTG